MWPREPWNEQQEGGAVVNAVAAEAVLDVMVVNMMRRINDAVEKERIAIAFPSEPAGRAEIM